MDNPNYSEVIKMKLQIILLYEYRTCKLLYNYYIFLVTFPNAENVHLLSLKISIFTSPYATVILNFSYL